MSTPEILATGLGGAIGSEFNPTTNQLFFVEYDGKVSRLDLIRPAATIVSSGTTTLQGTFLFDFDTGTMGGPGGSGWDVWWRQQTSVKRRMEVRSGAEIVRLGGVGFNTVSAAAPVFEAMLLSIRP